MAAERQGLLERLVRWLVDLFFARRARRREADAQARQTLREVENEVEGLPDDARRRELHRFVRNRPK